MQKLSFPTAKIHSLFVLLLALACVVAFMFPETWLVNLDFQRTAMLNGQWWRGLTAHLLHTNEYHLLLNLGGLALLWALHGEQYSHSRLTVVYLTTALSICLGIYVFSSDIQRYVGLSGVLHGLFIWGACNDIRLNRLSGYALIIGASIKIGSEQWQGPDEGLASVIDATVAIDAHLYGAIAGAVAFVFTQLLSPQGVHSVSSNKS